MLTGLRVECDALLTERPELWKAFRGARMFVTGGTGFVGCSLLELLLHANDRYALGAQLLVLTRDAAAFRKKAPHLALHPAVTTQTGDVRTFDRPAGRFDYVVHGATAASRELNDVDPLVMMDTIVEGTRRTLEFAANCGCRKLLFISSGAVYGRQLADLETVDEEYPGGPDPTSPGSAYGEGKRAAELLCVLQGQRTGFEAKIARGFAFVGPYLPLDRHLAIGNFIGDALAGRPIVVRGDGRTVRSYMYSLDMALWLLTILIDGVAGRAYNVGSEDAISVGGLARLVARTCGGDREVEIRGTTTPGARVDRYVPSTNRARVELGLRPTVTFDAAIARSIEWYKTDTSGSNEP